MKIIWALQAEYSFEARTIWLLVQNLIYNLSGKKVPSVEKVRSIFSFVSVVATDCSAVPEPEVD